MLEQVLLDKFNKNVTSQVIKSAELVTRNDLIKEVEHTIDKDIINIKSTVISDSLLSEYNCKIIFDIKSMDVIGTYCSCADHEKNEFKKENYCCKHLVATFYEFINKACNDSELSEILSGSIKEKKNSREHEDEILKSLIDTRENHLKLEVILSKNHWSSKLQAEFKIGLRNKKMYVIKDLNHFLISLFNNVPIKYGKDFTLNIKEQKFSYEDNRLIKFICSLQKFNDNSSLRRQDRIIDGKLLTIPSIMVKEFLSIVRKNRIFLGDGFFYRILECDVIEKDMPISFSLKSTEDGITLEVPDMMPEPLSDNNDVFLYGTSLYIPSIEQCERLEPYLNIFNKTRKIVFDKKAEEVILRKLIPNMQKITTDLSLSHNIRKKIISGPVRFKFYFDKDRSNISLVFKVSYEGHEFNYFDECSDKIIYRDTSSENEVFNLLQSLGFKKVNEKLYFLNGDDEIFKFFRYEIEKLQRYGEVFYSERFKGIKSIKKSDFKGEVRKGKFDYFELKFKLSDISDVEVVRILRSFRDNLKYYKLENGEYLDLEEEALKEALTLLDGLIMLENEEEYDSTLIPMSKGAYVEDYLENKGFRYIKTCDEMKELKERLHNIENKVFQPPYGLMASLRDYQKQGYNWMRTLDYLGFGGILADEMGLGKTLQTITFILSRQNSKTLIVAPTSLIYNWLSEFKKFAPSIKVLVCNGTPEERKQHIEGYEDYDVIITTYNMLRNDLEHYKMNFDYCILDEAQNIKNPHSLNTQCVKKIHSRVRFALTGTPIENSLMELWSIFDFIMPEYLYDEKRFNTRYFRRLEEEPEILDEIHKMVNPFILRRLKKNVIKELPEKIEKTMFIPLNYEQKKVYETYAGYARNLIVRKVENDEFKKSRIEILSYLTKLRQICLDPSVTMDSYSGGSGKIDALIDLLEQSIEGKHKVLVFSQFTSVLKNISSILKETNINFCYLDGSVASSRRITMVNEFNEEDTDIFLISLKAGGTGLNLTSADIVIHFDPWWNPAVEDQATDRAHRIGQKNVVEVIKLIASDTVEEKILELQNSKRELIDKVLSDDISTDAFINRLDDDEILKLFN